MKNQKRFGFTLIELLVVVAIIGLIASVTMIAVRNSREKARLVSTAQFAATVQHSLGAFGAGIWEFKEGANDTCLGAKDACDSSGNANHGENYGAIWTNSNPSGSGWSLGFNGTSNFVDCGNKSSLDLTGKATIMAWIKMAALPSASAYGIIWKGGNYKFGITQTAPAGRILSVSGTTVYSTKSISAGEWHHVAISFNSGVAKFYVDGAADNSVSHALGVTDASILFMGKGLTTGEYFNGLIDDARVYSEAITLTQIQKIYAEGADRLGLANE